MLKKKNRVLAYSLAKEIPLQELTAVSGGRGLTQYNTFRASGVVSSLDVLVDHQFDS